MRRLEYILVAAAFVCSAASVSAQNADYGYENRFRDNWFVSGAAGVNALQKNIGHFDSPATLGLDFNFGKWFTPMFGARVGWQGLNVKTPDSAYGYNYVHGDLMWDWVNTFGEYRNDRIWTFAPYVHVGMVLNTSDGSLATKGFGAGVGLQNGFRVTSFMSLYLDLRATMLNERSVGSTGGKAAMATALAGIQFDLGRSDWESVPRRLIGKENDRLVNRGFWQDWFVSAGGGVNVVTNGGHWTGHPAGNLDFAVGKWFSSYAGARLGLQGLDARQNISRNKYHFAYAHADLLWNWTNTFCRTKGTHLWTAAPYLHLGVFATGNGTEFAAGAGLYNAFAVSPHFDIFADLRGTLINGRSAHRAGGMLLQPSLQAGVAYNFSRRQLLYRQKPGARPVREYNPAGDGVQNNGFGANWSIYAAGGVNMFSADVADWSGAGWRPSFDVGVKKMFSPGFGGRLGVQVNSLETRSGKRQWQYLHGDILWDIRGSVAGYDPERIYSIAPYVTMGVSFVENGRLSMRGAGGFGLLNSFKLARRLDLFVDLRGIVMSERQFGAPGGYAIETSAMAGLAFELGKNCWDHNGDGSYLNKFWDNWFIQSLGGFSLMWDSRSRFNGRPAPAMELALGKWFSPMWGARLGFMYEGLAKSGGHEYDNGYVHGDLLWNFSNTVAGWKSDRIYTASPYLHFGVMGAWKHFGAGVGRDFVTGVGLMNDIRIDDKASFVVDLRGKVMPGRLTGKAGGKAASGEVLVGLNYSLGEGGWAPQRHTDDERGPLAISTNLMDWLDLGTANLSVEYAFARRWSADVVTEYNFLSLRGGALKDKRRGVTVGVRYWPWHTYSGFWVRPFMGAESSDAAGLPLKFLNKRCDRFGAGVSGGYSLMIARNLNLDFGIGFWGGLRHDLPGGTETNANGTAPARSWGGYIAPKDIRISLMFVL